MNTSQLTAYLIKRVSSMDVQPHPFPVFTADDILPTEVFHALRRSFPTSGFKETTSFGYHNRWTLELGEIATFNVDSVDGDQKILQELIRSEPAWGMFISSLSSPEFLFALKKKLVRHLWRERGIRVFLPWKVTAVPKSGSGSDWHFGVTPRMALHSIAKGGTVAPHKDASRKLITLLFYFADDDWKEEWGGSTNFFRFKSKKAEQLWRQQDWSWHNPVPEDDYQQFYDWVEVYAQGEFKPNALGGFCSGHLSYHAVNPIQIDESRQRRTVLLTFDITPAYTTFNIFAQRLGNLFRGMKAKPKS